MPELEDPGFSGETPKGQEMLGSSLKDLSVFFSIYIYIKANRVIKIVGYITALPQPPPSPRNPKYVVHKITATFKGSQASTSGSTIGGTTWRAGNSFHPWRVSVWRPRRRHPQPKDDLRDRPGSLVHRKASAPAPTNLPAATPQPWTLRPSTPGARSRQNRSGQAQHRRPAREPRFPPRRPLGANAATPA